MLIGPAGVSPDVRDPKAGSGFSGSQVLPGFRRVFETCIWFVFSHFPGFSGFWEILFAETNPRPRIDLQSSFLSIAPGCPKTFCGRRKFLQYKEISYELASRNALGTWKRNRQRQIRRRNPAPRRKMVRLAVRHPHASFQEENWSAVRRNMLRQLPVCKTKPSPLLSLSHARSFENHVS